MLFLFNQINFIILDIVLLSTDFVPSNHTDVCRSRIEYCCSKHNALTCFYSPRVHVTQAYRFYGVQLTKINDQHSMCRPYPINAMLQVGRNEWLPLLFPKLYSMNVLLKLENLWTTEPLRRTYMNIRNTEPLELRANVGVGLTNHRTTESSGRNEEPFILDLRTFGL